MPLRVDVVEMKAEETLRVLYQLLAVIRAGPCSA